MGRLSAIVLIAVLLLGAGALSLSAFGVPAATTMTAASVRVGSVATQRSSSRRRGGGVIYVGGSRSRSGRYAGGGGFGGFGK